MITYRVSGRKQAIMGCCGGVCFHQVVNLECECGGAIFNASSSVYVFFCVFFSPTTGLLPIVAALGDAYVCLFVSDSDESAHLQQYSCHRNKEKDEFIICLSNVIGFLR